MKPLIVANWKMNPATLKGAKLLFNSLEKGLKNLKNAEVVICPPFIYLAVLGASTLTKSFGGLRLGSQDCFWEEGGAYTGQISPKMLKNLGVEYVILGHSERRKLGESDAMISKKIKAAWWAGLRPILCIATPEDVKNVEHSVFNIANLVFAFEPISAVGTGKAFSVRKAKKIRAAIKHPFVLYGGSVNCKNARNYIKESGFQGLLIGQASLKLQEFVKIVEVVSR